MTGSKHIPHLTVLPGGRSLPPAAMHRVLLDAYATDTRLMGVLAVVARWSMVPPGADRDDPDSWEDLQQFFYIDCEEAGLETCQLVRGNSEEDEIEAERIENALTCGLGARKVELDERELRLLLQTWAGFNQERGLPLPPDPAGYRFLLEPRIEADPVQLADLMKKTCPPLESDEQVVNYFLMRCFGRDCEGAAYLCADANLPLDIYDRYVCATFYRNQIDISRRYSDGAQTYRCESLIEMNGSYETVISLVTVRNRKVVDFENVSHMPISGAEAALILKKVEYITLLEFFLSEEDLEANIDEFTLGFRATMSEFNNGRLFMRYRENNDHVNSRLFLLYNDVEGMYFLTDAGQLLLCAYTPEDLRRLERSIIHSPLHPYLQCTGRFSFVPGHTRTPAGSIELAKPVLFDFMNSDYEYFEDFLRQLGH